MSDAHEPSAGTVDEATPVESSEAPPATAPVEADGVLLESVALAQRALLEVTAPETVGSVIGHVVEGEHVLSLHFAADLAGYPGWHWSVTLARVEEGEPTVLETELMPGERALLAPEWVPWSERLAEYRAAQAAAAAEAAADEADDGADVSVSDDDAGEEQDESDDEGFADDADDADDDADDADADDVFDGIDIDALDEPSDDGSDDADPDDAADEDSDDPDDARDDGSDPDERAEG